MSDAVDGIRVMIADDEQSIRQGLEKIIGLDPSMELVGIATNAEEAISLAREHQPRVALLDINMPGGGGPRATAGIRSVSPRTMVIAHSVHDDRAAVMEMVRAGAVGYLVKGAGADEILGTLRRAGQGQSSLSPEVVSTVVFELASILNLENQQAEARRAQVAQVRRVLAGEGLSSQAWPVINLQTGTLEGAHLRVVAPPGTIPDSVEQLLQAAAAVGYREELELSLAQRGLRQVGDAAGAGFLAVRVSAATVVMPAFIDVDTPPGVRPMLVIDGSREAADVEELRAAVSRLRQRGWGIGIDGAARSRHAVDYALALQPTVLQLDCQVGGGLEDDPAVAALVSGMGTFAVSLGARLLVDGISSAAQAESARRAGAQLGMGPHFPPPPGS